MNATTINEMTDAVLGRVIVRPNVRARRMVFRAKADGIYVTVPPHTTPVALRQALDKLRDRLAEARRQAAHPLIDWNYRIEADCFRLSLVPGTRPSFLADRRPGVVRLICPPETDFADPQRQEWLHRVVEHELRLEAARLLPGLLRRCADRTGLGYRSVKVNASQGRWGSCSLRKDINLSCYLLLLPPHLIDYVLTHELCHTVEMNHSTRFWALADRLTGGRAQALRKELRNYRPVV